MKKVAITQDLCRMVELMLKGGAKPQEIGERLGISKTTVSRIKTAGYDAEQYRKNTEKRVAEENGVRTPQQVLDVEETEHGIVITDRARMQQPGQISIDDLPAEEQKAEMSDQAKLMRFLAGKMDKIESRLNSIDAKESTINMSILLKSDEIERRIDKLIDYMAQILRKLDG